MNKMKEAPTDSVIRQVDEIAEEYLEQEYGSWKHNVMDLVEIARKYDIFSKNTIRALDYLDMVIMNTLCKYCDDDTAFTWFNVFCRAWLDRKEIPLFEENCHKTSR